MTSESLPDDRYLVDQSVYARAAHPSVAPIWKAAVEKDLLHSCGPFVLEALYSSRDHAAYRDAIEELTVALPYLPVDDSTWRLAYDVGLDMARVAPLFHRRSPADYVLFAAAHQHRATVLHYDRDFELMARHSHLKVTHRWVVPPGTADLRDPDPMRPYRRGVVERLAQFRGEEHVPVFQRVVAMLDSEIEKAGLTALEPVTES
jgi:predicted nucleic acid-binding protein